MNCFCRLVLVSSMSNMSGGFRIRAIRNEHQFNISSCSVSNGELSHSNGDNNWIPVLRLERVKRKTKIGYEK